MCEVKQLTWSQLNSFCSFLVKGRAKRNKREKEERWRNGRRGDTFFRINMSQKRVKENVKNNKGKERRKERSRNSLLVNEN